MVERSITCAHSSLGSLTFYQKLGQQQCKLGARMCLPPAAGQFIEQTVNTLRQLLRCCGCRSCWCHGGCGFGHLWQHRYGGTTNSKAKCCNFQMEICAQQHVEESAGMVLCPAWLLATSKSHRLHSLWFQFLWRLIGWHLFSRSRSLSLSLSLSSVCPLCVGVRPVAKADGDGGVVREFALGYRVRQESQSRWCRILSFAY